MWLPSHRYGFGPPAKVLKSHLNKRGCVLWVMYDWGVYSQNSLLYVKYHQGECRLLVAGCWLGRAEENSSITLFPSFVPDDCDSPQNRAWNIRQLAHMDAIVKGPEWHHQLRVAHQPLMLPQDIGLADTGGQPRDMDQGAADHQHARQVAAGVLHPLLASNLQLHPLGIRPLPLQLVLTVACPAVGGSGLQMKSMEATKNHVRRVPVFSTQTRPLLKRKGYV